MLTPVILANVFRLHSFFVWFCVAARNSCQFLRIAGVETKNSFMSRTIITVLFFLFSFPKGVDAWQGQGWPVTLDNVRRRSFALAIVSCKQVLTCNAPLDKIIMRIFFFSLSYSFVCETFISYVYYFYLRLKFPYRYL